MKKIVVIAALAASFAGFGEEKAVDAAMEDAKANNPVLAAVAQKYGRRPDYGAVTAQPVTLDERVSLIGESVSLADGKVRVRASYGAFVRQCQYLQSSREVLAAIRKYLRSQGRSFVTKDGVNPCVELMKELNAALNSPRLGGLNAWLEKVGVSARLDESQLPTEEFVTQLKEDVLNGERDMTENVAFVLKVNLGVDGYNEFVREYNGEK